MAVATFDVGYTEQRNRGTVLVRLILAIPHGILMSVWQYVAQLVAVAQWFIILFTGKRNEGIFKLQVAWLGYASRVSAYLGLMSDVYPAFGSDAKPEEPVTFALAYEEGANRLTNGLRLIWAIPAILIGMVIGIGLYVMSIVAWFVIVFTGSLSRSQFDFLVKGHRYFVNLNAYTLLMTDDAPKYR